MIMHQLYINYTHNIWHSLALSWCWKTQSVPRPELILDRNLSCFCVFSYVFLVFVVKRGFNEEPELARKVASFWKHWAALEVRRGSDAEPVICRWSRFRQGKELGLRLLREVISKASWDWELLGLLEMVYICLHICLHLSTVSTTFVHCETHRFLLTSSMLLLLLDEIKQKFHQIIFLPKTLHFDILTHCDTRPPWRPAPDVAASLRRLWPQQWSWWSPRSWQKVWRPHWNIGDMTLLAPSGFLWKCRVNHVNLPNEIAIKKRAGLSDQQNHWENDGYTTFSDTPIWWDMVGCDGWHWRDAKWDQRRIVLSYKKIASFCMVFLRNNMICQAICSANHHWQPIIHQPVIHQPIWRFPEMGVMSTLD